MTPLVHTVRQPPWSKGPAPYLIAAATPVAWALALTVVLGVTGLLLLLILPFPAIGGGLLFLAFVVAITALTVAACVIATLALALPVAAFAVGRGMAGPLPAAALGLALGGGAAAVLAFASLAPVHPAVGALIGAAYGLLAHRDLLSQWPALRPD